MRIIAHAVILAAVTLASPAVRAEDGERYRLGVQDRLRVHVHEWPVLTGEFVVGANGMLTLPLIGGISAKGLDLDALSEEIGNRLREKVGLGKAPETTVDIAQYRPFYILGGVERPGEYSYRPGMLVVNAVAIAGGVYRPPRTSDWGFERDAITGRGDLRLAAVRRDEIRAKELRLKAEADGSQSFPAVPQNLSPGAMKFIDEERVVFAARLDRFLNQTSGITDSIALYEAEINSLKEQIVSATKQEESVARELKDTKGLVERSLIPAPRILPIERTLAQIEREKKEIDTHVLRARQQINMLSIQRESLKDERRGNALAELQTLDTQLKELNERAETYSRIASGSNSMLSRPQEGLEVEMTPSFVVIRQQDGGKVVEMKAVETTVLQPGDIVKVFRPQESSQSAQGSVSAAEQITTSRSQ